MHIINYYNFTFLLRSPPLVLPSSSYSAPTQLFLECTGGYPPSKSIFVQFYRQCRLSCQII